MTAEMLHSLFDTFRSKRLLVIGDVMLDRFLWGNVSRISPEAPVPVVEVAKESSYPGGAANVARNLVPFCPGVSVVGVVGNEPHADELLGLLSDTAIETAHVVRDPEHQTILKTRVIARSQQVVRIDRERIRKSSPELVAEILEQVGNLLPQLDGIIVEDYGKGLITQRLVDGLAELVSDQSLVITVDPNPSNPLRWKRATAVKPNRSEAFKAADLLDPAPTESPSDETLAELARRLFEKWETDVLLITLGDHGMALMQKGEPIYRIPTRAKEVFDVSGAGDTAIALFTLALTAGVSPSEAAELSNYASGVVVGKVGTATLAPEELLGAVD